MDDGDFVPQPSSDDDSDGGSDIDVQSGVGRGEAAELAAEEQDRAREEQIPTAASKGKKLRVVLKGKAFGAEAVCHVCGERGHNAGFLGAVYQDCPNRPCYLCKQPGHTTQTCPFRVMPGQTGVTKRRNSLIVQLNARRLRGSPPSRRRALAPSSIIPKRWVVSAARLHLHSRRVTAALFHPIYPIIVTADKYGEIGTFNYDTGDENVWRPHRWLTTAVRWCSTTKSTLYSASVDGLVLENDLDTQQKDVLLNLNKGRAYNQSTWVSLYSLAHAPAYNVVLCGDNFGRLHVVDSRASSTHAVQTHTVHKKNKVPCIDVNPVANHAFVTCGNDHHMSIWDLRSVTKGRPSDDYLHPRVVNSAYFSPLTGSRLVSTCIDNRLRVWDNAVVASLDPPSTVIVHSHDFSRYLTPFKATFDPKDPLERIVVCGRYISEEFNGVALHPLDIIDVGGSLASGNGVIGQLYDPLLTTICPVAAVHPSKDMIACGTSRSLFLWRPLAGAAAAEPDPDQEEDAEMKREEDVHTARRKTAARKQRGAPASASAAAGAAPDDGSSTLPFSQRHIPRGEGNLLSGLMALNPPGLKGKKKKKKTTAKRKPTKSKTTKSKSKTTKSKSKTTKRKTTKTTKSKKSKSAAAAAASSNPNVRVASRATKKRKPKAQPATQRPAKRPATQRAKAAPSAAGASADSIVDTSDNDGTAPAPSTPVRSRYFRRAAPTPGSLTEDARMTRDGDESSSNDDFATPPRRKRPSRKRD